MSAATSTFARTGRPLAINRAAQASVFIIAISTLLDRMSDRNAKPPIPDTAWPNDTYSSPVKNLSFNGEAIQIFHQPATTDGDSIVLFRAPTSSARATCSIRRRIPSST